MSANLAKDRYNRLAQQRHRGSKRSPKTEVEDLKICLAWENGELTEGQAVAAMGYDRVTCRGILQDAVMEGRELYRALAPVRVHLIASNQAIGVKPVRVGGAESNL